MSRGTDFFETAKQQLSADEPSPASVSTKKGLIRDPASLTGATLLGIISTHVDDTDRALNYMRWSIPASGGSDCRAYANLAKLYEIVRDESRAFEAYKAALALDPDQKTLEKILKFALGLPAGERKALLMERALSNKGGPAVLKPNQAAAIFLHQKNNENVFRNYPNLLSLAASQRHELSAELFAAIVDASPKPKDPDEAPIAKARLALLFEPSNPDLIPGFVDLIESRKQKVRAATWFCQYAVLKNDKGKISRLAARKAYQVKWPWRALGRLFVLDSLNEKNTAYLELFVEMFSLFVQDEEKQYAVNWAKRKFALNSDDPRIWDSALRMLHFIDRDDEAEEYWAIALRKFPDAASLFHNRGLFLQETRRPEESGLPLKKSLVLNPAYERAYNILGMYYSSIGDLDSAIKNCGRAIKNSPNKSSYWMNMGTFLRAKHEFAAATKAFETAMAYSPNYAEAHFNTALTSLMLGEISKGFHHYQQRWAIESFPSTRRRFRHSIWEGPIKHPMSRVLVFMEQGLGDEVMFSWYLSFLQSDALQVIVDCDHRLIGIMKRTFPSFKVVPRPVDESIFKLDKQAHLRDADYKIPIGHLPCHYVGELKQHISNNKHLYTQRGTKQPPRLVADPEKVEFWRRAIKERFGDKKVIGISWRSSFSTAQRDAQYVSIPELSEALAADVGVINLQYSYRESECEQLEEMAEKFGFDFYTPPGIDLKDDLDDIFAILQCCDACVTPLISLAWMSGAVGTPTWVFRTASELRTFHMIGTPFVPWAPSIKLFFRKPRTSWKSAISAINATVRHMVETGEAADVCDPADAPAAMTW